MTDGTGPLDRPVTTLGYDVANRLTSKSDPLGGKGGTNLPQTTINTSGLVPMMGGSISSFANTTAEGGAYPEIQTIKLSNATSGTWRVAYNGEISTALATSITASALKSALDAFVVEHHHRRQRRNSRCIRDVVYSAM